MAMYIEVVYFEAVYKWRFTSEDDKVLLKLVIEHKH